MLILTFGFQMTRTDTYTMSSCCMIVTFLAVHGNRSKRGYGRTYNPVSMVNMCYASVYGGLLVLQMVYLCRAGNLMQNGGMTSGNDMFLVGFDLCM